MGIYSDKAQAHINDVSVKTDDETRAKNRELCEKYPFLIPHNVFSGKRITDCVGPDGEKGYWPETPDDHPVYDYEYTVLDEMPDGWRKAFGEKMCADIQAELDENDPEGEVYVLMIKEKWGRLEMYMSGYTDNLMNIIDRYGELSKKYCIECGAPATLLSTGYILPWCGECAMTNKGTFGSYVSIDGEGQQKLWL